MDSYTDARGWVGRRRVHVSIRLSLRNVLEMLACRGVTLAPYSIWRRVQRYVAEVEKASTQNLAVARAARKDRSIMKSRTAILPAVESRVNDVPATNELMP